MEVVGYAEIKQNAIGTSAIPMKNFQGQICRVMEFAHDGGVLVIDSEGTGLAMFEKEDIHRSFKCSLFGEFVCPPNSSILDQMGYGTKCQMRKGGYDNLLKQMVIQCSLMKGEFTDNILWANQ